MVAILRQKAPYVILFYSGSARGFLPVSIFGIDCHIALLRNIYVQLSCEGVGAGQTLILVNVIGEDDRDVLGKGP
jgi:hypothetical protein